MGKIDLFREYDVSASLCLFSWWLSLFLNLFLRFDFNCIGTVFIRSDEFILSQGSSTHWLSWEDRIDIITSSRSLDLQQIIICWCVTISFFYLLVGCTDLWSTSPGTLFPDEVFLPRPPTRVHTYTHPSVAATSNQQSFNLRCCYFYLSQEFIKITCSYRLIVAAVKPVKPIVKVCT